jgi:hypothetical protein
MIFESICAALNVLVLFTVGDWWLVVACGLGTPSILIERISVYIGLEHSGASIFSCHHFGSRRMLKALPCRHSSVTHAWGIHVDSITEKHELCLQESYDRYTNGDMDANITAICKKNPNAMPE